MMPTERMPQESLSWMSRPLMGLTATAIRFPKLTLALALLGVIVSSWLTTTQLGFRTNRAELLSPKSDYHRRWLEYTKEFGDKEDVVIVVEGSNLDQVSAALDDLCRNIRQRKDLFGAVMHHTDAPKLRAKGLYQLQLDDLRQIDAFLNQFGGVLRGDWSQLSLGAMGRQMNAAASGGSERGRQQVLEAMRAELPRLVASLTAALGQEGGYKSPWPETSFAAGNTEPMSQRLVTDDGRLGFILLRLLEEDRQSFAQNKEAITVLRRYAAEAQRRFPGTKVGLTGLPIIEYDEMRSSEKSMSLATTLSFVGVLAVMVIAFGRLRHSLMAMIALLMAMVWACGCVSVTVGHVNILTIAFGSVLLGLGIDYGIYYVARYLQLRETTESTSEALIATAGSAGPGILTGALTAAIAFFAAGLTDFPGVAQLGVIAGGGVLLCWVAEAVVLPAMIRLFDRDGHTDILPTPLNMRFWMKPLFAFPRLTLVAAIGVTGVTILGMGHLRYDYNLLNLQPEGLESVELEHKLFNLTNRSAWFAVSLAKTAEEVEVRKAAFMKLPSIERVVEVASRLPRDAAQKRPLIEAIHQRLAQLPEHVPTIPVTPAAELQQMLAGAPMLLGGQAETAAGGLQALGEMLRQMPPEESQRRISSYQQALARDLHARLRTLQSVSNPEPPTTADLPSGVAERFIGRSGTYALQVFSKANVWEVGPMGQFVADIRSVDPEATGNPMQVYEASRQMKRSFELAAIYALCMVVPIVLLDFRRLNHTLLAALPVAVGLLQTLGLMGLLGIPLNQANMIVLPLTLGIGMESGINLIHDMRRQRGGYSGAGNAVIVGVVVNSLTTMVGFGALMVANHRGLQSLGRVLTLSMGCCLFCSLLLPNLLKIGRFYSAEGDNEAYDDEDWEDDEELDDDGYEDDGSLDEHQEPAIRIGDESDREDDRPLSYAA